MLSILIPVYNFDVRHLVSQLDRQCNEAKIDYEIICLDDGSDEGFRKINKQLPESNNINYYELGYNSGRSAIRNKLADLARFENLLFMDCDSDVISDSYIKKYIQKADNCEVIYGGRTYTASPPADRSRFFRWKYGKKREQIPAYLRKENPYIFFLTNNFLIKKEIFLSIRLNEDLKGYGHEDTLLAYEFKNKSIHILHIDNPLCHIGLETAEEFLIKTKQGIENLKLLMKKYAYAVEEIKLVKVYKRINLPLIKHLIKWPLKLFHKAIYKNLCGSNPDLLLFDFYKLYLILNEEE